MITEIEKLINSFKKELPDFDSLMYPGATCEEINHLEKYVKQKLPTEYIELLKKYNGEKDISCCLASRFINIEEIKREWKSFDNNYHIEPEQIYQKDKICNSLFSDKRIPFAHDGSGNYLCFDYIPNKNGKEGQIIYLPMGDPEPISVIADSFKEFVIFLINAIENKKLVLVDERDPEEMDCVKLDLYFYHTWKDDWTDIAEEYNNKK